MSSTRGKKTKIGSVSGMGIPWDDVVLIQQGKKPGDPSVITVNCPDKAGLGCDLCRIVVDFGLSITKGGPHFYNSQSQDSISSSPSQNINPSRNPLDFYFLIFHFIHGFVFICMVLISHISFLIGSCNRLWNSLILDAMDIVVQLSAK